MSYSSPLSGHGTNYLRKGSKLNIKSSTTRLGGVKDTDRCWFLTEQLDAIRCFIPTLPQNSRIFESIKNRALLYISIITHPPTPPPPPSLKKRQGRKFAASDRPQTLNVWCRDWNLRADRRAWRKRHNRGGRRDRQYASTEGNVSPVG